MIVVLLTGGGKRTQRQDVKTAFRRARNLKVETMTKTVASPYDVAEHFRTPEEMGTFRMTAIGENWVTLDSTEAQVGTEGFARARLPGSAGFQPAMGRRRTMVHAGKIPVLAWNYP